MKPQARQYISDLAPYQVGTPISVVARNYGLDANNIIKLASNENPLGMSPKAAAAVTEFMPKEAHMYPDQFALTHKLAAKLGVEPERVVVGSGSSDIIDLIGRTFVGTGKEGVTSRYAYVAHWTAIQVSGGRNVVVPDKDYGHDLEAMLAAITPNTGMVSVVNPNNPTGTLLTPDELERFIERVPKHVVVVLDQAYYEYLNEDQKWDGTAWTAKYPNLVVTRTFSKVYGLAGLRVGYAVASPEIVAILNRVRLPFNVNSLALTAAEAALDDNEFITKSVELNRAGQTQLRDGFKALGVAHLPISGNFVAFKAGEHARDIQEELVKRGVILRGMAPYGIRDHLRVSIGTEAENQRFLDTIAEVLKIQA